MAPLSCVVHTITGLATISHGDRSQDRRIMSLWSLLTQSLHGPASAPYSNRIFTPEASPAPFPSPHTAENWFDHAWCNGVASEIQDGMARLFDPDRTHIETWPSIRDIDCPWYWGRSTRTKASPLYYAALLVLEASWSTYLLITRRQDPNKGHCNQGTPLPAVIISGQTEVTRLLLLECTADLDVNAREEQHDPHRRNPHQLWCRHIYPPTARTVTTARSIKEFDIVEFLFKVGADVNIRNKVRVDTAQLLISRGANLDTLDRHGVSTA
jgi:hypothetical protein